MERISSQTNNTFVVSKEQSSEIASVLSRYQSLSSFFTGDELKERVSSTQSGNNPTPVGIQSDAISSLLSGYQSLSLFFKTSNLGERASSAQSSDNPTPVETQSNAMSLLLSEYQSLSFVTANSHVPQGDVNVVKVTDSVSQTYINDSDFNVIHALCKQVSSHYTKNFPNAKDWGHVLISVVKNKPVQGMADLESPNSLYNFAKVQKKPFLGINSLQKFYQMMGGVHPGNSNIHGIDHAFRAMLLSMAVGKWLRKTFTVFSNLSDRQILLGVLGAAFHDSGRQTDGKDYYDYLSAWLAGMSLSGKSLQGEELKMLGQVGNFTNLNLTSAEIDTVVSAIANKDHPENSKDPRVTMLVQLADNVEIARCVQTVNVTNYCIVSGTYENETDKKTYYKFGVDTLLAQQLGGNLALRQGETWLGAQREFYALTSKAKQLITATYKSNDLNKLRSEAKKLKF